MGQIEETKLSGCLSLSCGRISLLLWSCACQSSPHIIPFVGCMMPFHVVHQILSLSVSLAQLPPSVARLAAHTFVCRFCEDSHRVESVLGMCALPVPMSEHTAVASAAAAAASNDALSSSLDASAAAPAHLLFLVKWHRRSFWHVSWVTESRLRALAPRKCTKFVRDFAPSQVHSLALRIWDLFFARAPSPFSHSVSLSLRCFFFIVAPFCVCVFSTVPPHH